MPPPPVPVTPLDWKIYEAIGEPLPTASLPVAFAYAELAPAAGWKAQIEAAERLTRAGTIAPNVILGLYTERDPRPRAGSGTGSRPFRTLTPRCRGRCHPRAQTLPVAWARMQEAELEVPFACSTAGCWRAGPDRRGGRHRLSGGAVVAAMPRRWPAPAPPPTMTEAFLAGLAQARSRGCTRPTAWRAPSRRPFLAPRLSDRAQALIWTATGWARRSLLAIEEIARRRRRATWAMA
jgi:hypothetical protein